MTAKDIKRQDVIHGMAVQFDICFAKYYRLFVNIISAFLGRCMVLPHSKYGKTQKHRYRKYSIFSLYLSENDWIETLSVLLQN